MGIRSISATLGKRPSAKRRATPLGAGPLSVDGTVLSASSRSSSTVSCSFPLAITSCSSATPTASSIKPSVGGRLSPVVNYSSGLPYTLSYNNCSTANVGSAPCYLNGSSGNINSHPTGLPGQGLTYYAPFASDSTGSVFSSPGQPNYSAPGLDQIGTVGRNTAFGPHFFNADISVQKNFIIREGTSFQLRADGFNSFNHINWGNPNGNIQNGGCHRLRPIPERRFQSAADAVLCPSSVLALARSNLLRWSLDSVCAMQAPADLELIYSEVSLCQASTNVQVDRVLKVESSGRGWW